MSSLTLYIHLPWCVKKCPYCDFNSHALPQDGGQPERYLQAVLADLEQALPAVWGRSISAVFIGGGTPNVFSPQWIDELLAGCRARLPWLAGIEVTMEANPGAAGQADQIDWKGYRQAGVNRLSVGVQSFHGPSLVALGRVHTAEQAEQAVRQAVGVFDRVNLDLMYGLPGQSLGLAEQDLQTALGLGIGHLSLYQLTIEPNTWFAHQPPVLPDDDLVFEMQQSLTAMLAQAGLDRYEVSAYARPGQRCAHNLNYWQFGDYLGIGAGAHSKLTRPGLADDQGPTVVRENCVRRPQDYMDQALAGQAAHRRQQLVAAQELPFEFMLNALRLVEGVPPALFRERTGLPIETVLPAIGQAVQKGLLQADVSCWRPTARGLDFLNDLQALFLHQ